MYRYPFTTEELILDAIFDADRCSAPWRKGKLIGQKPPLKLKEIWAIRIRLQLDRHTWGLALFNLAIDSKLRGCNLVAPRVRDVLQGRQVASRAIVTWRKTQVGAQAMSKYALKPTQGSGAVGHKSTLFFQREV